MYQIIETYNYIPQKIKNDKCQIVLIVFNFEERNIVLSIEPNYNVPDVTYKNIIELCNTNKIEWKNQTIGSITSELRKKHYDQDHHRHKFTKKEREQLFTQFNKKCKTCQKELKTFHIDHILPLASGGTNDEDNLQILCKECHFTKTKAEQDNHDYIKLSDTSSSYNDQVFDVMTSNTSSIKSFVETFVTKHKKSDIIYKIDMNKSRKNSIYYNVCDYPLFTVMDEVKIFISTVDYTHTGLYFLETDLYFPIRGNGWYSHAMVMFLIENSLITTDNIKYYIHSSLKIESKYFNSFIDECYNLNDGYQKLKVNSMIGSFKPSKKTNYRTLFIGTDLNTIYYHYLRSKGSFIDTFVINGLTYYQVLEKTESQNEESETAIYNMVLELENINLYKLSKLIEQNDGRVLDVNTDCCNCTFKNNVFPFKLDESNNLTEFCHDKLVPKYRLEESKERLKTQLLPRWTRTETYAFKQHEWQVLEDDGSNDFQPMVEQILNMNKSIFIEGRAGTGKSTFIKSLHAEMDKRDIKYISLAPTNKACRIINGITCAKFAISFNIKSFKNDKYKYIFIDEISMMSEMYYKFIMFLKRTNPNIKFILAGDFSQLLPVGDRLEDCDYKNKLALHELCDGNKFELSKCRRSDDTLFNMLKDDNISNIKKEQFTNDSTFQNICYTNKKRIAVNEIMMQKHKRLVKEKPLMLPKLEHDENSQDVQLMRGVPVIARVNSKSLDIANNELFKIKKISTDFITIKDEHAKSIDIPIESFQKLFYPAFAITVHKSQGSTFNTPYTVHEWERFNNRLKYVALSRSTDIKNINVL